jgi:hypothetical protein
MNKKTALISIAFTTVIMGTIACSFFSGLIDQGQGAVSTAQSVATLAGAGGELLETAQAIATEFDAGDLGATAQALATEINAEELLATAQVLVTDVDLDEFLLTAQAVGTQVAEGGGGDPIATAMAVATQLAGTGEEAPENVPLPGGPLENLFTSANLVSFTTGQSFDEILNFYEEEMIANGWSKVDEGSVVTGNTAVINFQMVGQKAVVTISGLQDGAGTVVQIILQSE